MMSTSRLKSLKGLIGALTLAITVDYATNDLYRHRRDALPGGLVHLNAIFRVLAEDRVSAWRRDTLAIAVNKPSLALITTLTLDDETGR